MDENVIHAEVPTSGNLTPVSLAREAAAVSDVYKNWEVAGVNDHCLRMAVMVGEYPWHLHPHSDECFLVLEGRVEIDLAEGRTVILQAGEMLTIPAGMRHRTRAPERSVNLCFEHRGAYRDTVFEDAEATR